MTVADLIAKLQQLPPHLPVCVADWSEQYVAPNEAEAEVVAVVDGHYRAKTGDGSTSHVGQFVCIGSDD